MLASSCPDTFGSSTRARSGLPFFFALPECLRKRPAWTLANKRGTHPLACQSRGPMIQVPSPLRVEVWGCRTLLVIHLALGQGVLEERTRHWIAERASPLERCLVAHEPSCAFADPPLKSLGVPES